MSVVFRKRDFHTTDLLGMLNSQEFQHKLVRASDFQNKTKRVTAVSIEPTSKKAKTKRIVARSRWRNTNVPILQRRKARTN
jgi:protein subunit release factor B